MKQWLDVQLGFCICAGFAIGVLVARHTTVQSWVLISFSVGLVTGDIIKALWRGRRR